MEFATAGAGGSPPKKLSRPNGNHAFTPSTQCKGFAGFTYVLIDRLWKKRE
jgi:hypothetical protein